MTSISSLQSSPPGAAPNGSHNLGDHHMAHPQQAHQPLMPGLPGGMPQGMAGMGAMPGLPGGAGLPGVMGLPGGGGPQHMEAMRNAQKEKLYSLMAVSSLFQFCIVVLLVIRN